MKSKIPQLLLKHLEEAEWKSILDVGCGSGELLRELDRRGMLEGKQVFAVDISRERIGIASAVNKGFKCFVGDACRLRCIKSSSIDFLVSTQVIEHVASDREMARQAARVLRPGGRAYISTVFRKPWAWYFYRCNGKWRLDPTHVREYTEEKQLLPVLEAAGLQVLETEKQLFWLSPGHYLKALRFLQFPVPGYYYWGIACRKNTKN